MVQMGVHPNFKVVVDRGGTDYALQKLITSVDVWMHENAAWNAQFSFADTDMAYYHDRVRQGDEVTIYAGYDKTLGDSDLVFHGFLEDLRPHLDMKGEIVYATCRGYNRCVLDLVCGEEYGSESVNPTLDELHEILQDGSNGILDLWVNKLLGNGATASGYSVNDTYIEEDTDAVKYLYFPFKPVKNCLDDLMDVYQALQGSSTAGWHWIIKPEIAGGAVTNYFCLTQIANHSGGAPDVASKWSTYWNSTAAASIIEVGKDMMVQDFAFRRPEANYVLYHGNFRKPGDGDRWTATTTGWDDNSGSCTITLDTDAGDYRVGSSGLNIDYGVNGGHARYPSTLDAAWDIENWGGDHNIPAVDFWIKTSSVYNALNLTFWFRLFTDWGPPTNAYDFSLNDLVTAATWYHYHIPMGPNAPVAPNIFTTGGWSATNNPDWGDIDFLDFQVIDSAGTGCIFHVDGLHFTGHILRGAKKASESYYKTKVITDDVAKDDSGKASDDSYAMAQLAYAELMRCSRRPMEGKIVLPMQPSILPGQLAHIHGLRKSDKTFRLDEDMRILEHHIHIARPAGFSSYLTLTDDLINGSPLRPASAYNTLLKASDPEFQSRQRSSLKTRKIDVTQTVLEKSYTFNDYY